MPPQVSPESVTLRASVWVVKVPSWSVMATDPSMEISAPSTGAPLSRTVTSSVDELVNTAPVIAWTFPSMEPPMTSISQPGWTTSEPTMLRFSTSRGLKQPHCTSASTVSESCGEPVSMLCPLAWRVSAMMEASTPLSCPVPWSVMLWPVERITSVESKVNAPLLATVRSPVS